MRSAIAHHRRFAGSGWVFLCCATWIALLATPAPAPGQTSPHGKLRFQCEECHSPASWKEMTHPSKFKHAKTGFALKGQHEAVKCLACHTSLKFAVTGKRCIDCHKDVHRNELGSTCDRCHTSDSWLVPDMIQRHSKTRFSLVGAHAQAACVACHKNTVQHTFVGVRTDCFGCHQADYEATKNPSHRFAGFTTDCASCHVVNAARWGGSFDHARTGFPLTGAHAAAACSQCHVGNSFAGTAAQCSSCHMPQFTAAKAPSHSGFSTECATCHTMTAWHPASFDHNKTGFALTGAHQAANCQQCHVNNVYKGTSTQCFGCHQADFTKAKSPSHSGFSTDCQTCHTMVGWRPASFDHSKTMFALTGAHMAVTCTDCHKNNVYKGTSTLCYTCHQQQFTSATNPSHAGFPTDCVTCHSTSAWRPSTFDHSRTNFRLTGAHMAVACNQCHKNNQYTGTTTLCFGCHQTDFAGATNPSHTGFSTTCQTCHSTSAWQPASFDHSKTQFPLTGAHMTAQCAQCHINNVYAGTPMTCGSSTCHLNDYNATTNPKHTAAQFNTDCQTCHNTTAWVPSTFNHTNFFPIAAGSSHPPGKWTLCTDCHTVPTDYSLFSCIDCHAHSDKAKVDAKHVGKSGYSYTSAACYRCHPTGRH
ncbi:MAG: hypothetical protein AB1428_06225 [Bacteroidota bacterium]